jgi:hypothetical protein
MGWFGDGPRPARPYSWPSQLDYLRQLYAAGIDDLNARAKSFGFASFDAMPAQGVPSRDSVLRQLHAQEAQAFDGKGEDHQPFFLTLLDHLTEACFGDPVYGGNKGWVYWKAIGFTGPAYVAATGPAPGNGWTPRDMTQQFDPNKTWADWTIP